MAGLSRAVLELAQQEGCSLDDVLAREGVRIDELGRSDSYVGIELHEALWAETARRTGRTDIGVYAAERFQPGLTGVVEYIMRNCSNVAEAVESWIKFASLVSDRVSGALEVKGPLAYLYWRLDRPASEGTRHWAEFAQGRALRLIRETMAMPDARPNEVWFRHGPPADIRRHLDFFGCPVHFAKPDHALVFSVRWLDQPLRGIDPVAKAALEQRADELREGLEEPSFVSSCMHAIEKLLQHDEPDTRLEVLANHLGLAPRTVQRRLRAEGSSFQTVLDAVRRREATRLAGRLPMSDLAERLGFSDAAAFRKARQRWSSTEIARTSEEDDR